MVQGALIEFDCPTDCLSALSRSQPSLSQPECDIIDDEINKLVKKKVLSECDHTVGQVISPVFTRKKKDGSHRMILNLKRLNEEVSYLHFKMDTLSTALKLITKNCFMASVDLKDAYYSVPIHPDHKKFVRFEWKGKLYEFNAFPNGLAMAPRKFTKLLKPVFSALRTKGHISTSFLDDSLLIGNTQWECIENIRDTLLMFDSLGFVIHPVKSVLTPKKQIQYLGVIIDSEQMTVRLTEERVQTLKECCQNLIKKNPVTIRDLARAIGLIVASFPAVRHGPLFYRCLEHDKKLALNKEKGDFDKSCSLSVGSRDELVWWIANVESAQNEVESKDPDVVVTSDASTIGWGCDCEGEHSGGLWSVAEKLHHINYLEILAAWFTLKCFSTRLQKKHVRMLIDNTTAVSCINNMGTSHSEPCNEVTNKMWIWCMKHEIWISAAHIPGKMNVVADFESRQVNWDAEWQLNKDLLQSALVELDFSPNIDLFASRLNAQFSTYVSYRADPEAAWVDAFSASWKDRQFYAFPPFSVLPRVMQKIRKEQSRGILVVPDWPTQVWFPVLQRMLLRAPVRLPCRTNLLQLPSYPAEVHPLVQRRRLDLLVCKVSGMIWEKAA